MAKANKKLIANIRLTAARLKTETPYQWGHLGACNCGHLVQTITNLSKAEIHEAAMIKDGDWGDVSEKYCPNSGYLVDDIITELIKSGLVIEDIEYLENLSDPKVLSLLPKEKPYLKYNIKEDLILYLKTWADLLEGKLRKEEQPIVSINKNSIAKVS